MTLLHAAGHQDNERSEMSREAPCGFAAGGGAEPQRNKASVCEALSREARRALPGEGALSPNKLNIITSIYYNIANRVHRRFFEAMARQAASD